MGSGLTSYKGLVAGAHVFLLPGLSVVGVRVADVVHRGEKEFEPETSLRIPRHVVDKTQSYG